ncbi:MAG: class I SAM-dependent methyltransferase [Candidatus Paceibacterota bacterium]|jgi:2-polyprenyl-3-methyl-5-hydroxy-6-metoxy-1,4-benzoquinol methylase
MNIKQVFFLDRRGEIVGTPEKQTKKVINSSVAFPIVVEYYDWDLDKQAKSAEQYKDQIKRVFYQEGVDDAVKVMLQDDVARLNLVQKLDYGSRILEVGSSDGSVSVKIAAQKKVREILAIDIRQSAISDGKKLVRDLVKDGEISASVAQKISLKKYAIQDLPGRYGTFDSVCAYEVFEHLAPWDMMPVFEHIYKFIKPKGKFFISVPNRFPDSKYEKQGRSRWRWFDHRNFFSQVSLNLFLMSFFKKVTFYPLYPHEKAGDSLYLICECYGKRF